MTTLFHFPRSLSSAAVQVVRELNAPVDICTLGFEDGQFTFPSSDGPGLPEGGLPTGGMGLIGPVRSCPTLHDTAHEPLTLIQCSAIIERLCDRFDTGNALRPAAGTTGRARHLSLMVFAEATFFPVVQFLSPPDSPNNNAREEMRRERFKGLIAPYLLDQLGDNDYMFGDSASACDFLLGMPCLNNASNAGVVDEFPKLVAYFDRLRSRPSFQEAHGAPDDTALSAALAAMVQTAHTDRWDFTYRAEFE